MPIEEINSDVHFHKSLEFLRLSHYQSALESIDLAIANNCSNNFYRFQKIKILFVAQMFSQCADYINQNLKVLYTGSSLHIFSQVLYYYHASSGCSLASLEDLLLTHGIPCILASEYSVFIKEPHIDLRENILSAQGSDDYITCIDYCDLYLNKDSSNVEVYLIKAKCHCLLGEHDLAVCAYEQAIDLAPNTPTLYNELGTAMLTFENYPRAICCFEKALELDPSNTEFTNQLAEAFYRWKNYDRALLHFKKVLAQNPKCTETLLRIANIYEYINKPRKAKKYYKKITASHSITL